MDYVGKVDGKMIELIFGRENSNHRAERIKLDIDGGDKTFTMDAHIGEMLDIGAMIVGRTEATTVRITSYNGGNLKRVIDFYPETGNYDLELDEWADDRMCETTLVIEDPTRKSLWEAISKYQLDFRSKGGDRWTFTGQHDNVVKFIREFFFLRFPALADEHIEDGGIIILN